MSFTQFSSKTRNKETIWGNKSSKNMSSNVHNRLKFGQIIKNIENWIIVAL